MNQQRYWLFKRGSVYYLQDNQTKKQQSLFTKDKAEAERLRNAKNDAHSQPQLNLALAKTYLSAYDPEIPRRRWRDVMEKMASTGREASQERCRRALASKAFDPIRDKKLIETTSDDFLAVLEANGSAAHHYLKRFHNLAVGLGWLPWPVLPPKLWPKCERKRRRAITWEEHQLIVQSEMNTERRFYYELLWELGASQMDCANLTAENVDWEADVIKYHRAKLRNRNLPPACQKIGGRLKRPLQQLPNKGLLFPKIGAMSSKHRSAEFCRRCKLLNLVGVSLHSYRYAWAQRAQAVGYPERFAQRALGHNSRAVHESYAQGGAVICPSLEEFEKKS